MKQWNLIIVTAFLVSQRILLPIRTVQAVVVSSLPEDDHIVNISEEAENLEQENERTMLPEEVEEELEEGGRGRRGRASRSTSKLRFL